MAPVEGDIRLVPLNATSAATATCDAVHFGSVELFHEGRWGRICNGRGRDDNAFTLDAHVVCRQLGFPFGTVMDAGEVSDAYEFDYYSDNALVWATQVRVLPHLTIVVGL